MQVSTLPEVRNVSLFRAAHGAVGSPIVPGRGEVGGVSDGRQGVRAGRTESALALKCERRYLPNVGSDRLCSAAAIGFEFTDCRRIRAAFIEHYFAESVVGSACQDGRGRSFTHNDASQRGFCRWGIR